MSDLEPVSPGAAPVPADGDNRYKAVQAKLLKLATTLDDGVLGLESLHRSMRGNASRTEGVATDIANAELDPKFVDFVNDASTALGGAAVEVRKLNANAEETTDLAHRAQRTHSKLYGALDEIRSNRREKTPRPGFLTN